MKKITYFMVLALGAMFMASCDNDPYRIGEDEIDHTHPDGHDHHGDTTSHSHDPSVSDVTTNTIGNINYINLSLLNLEGQFVQFIITPEEGSCILDAGPDAPGAVHWDGDLKPINNTVLVLNEPVEGGATFQVIPDSNDSFMVMDFRVTDGSNCRFKVEIRFGNNTIRAVYFNN